MGFQSNWFESVSLPTAFSPVLIQTALSVSHALQSHRNAPLYILYVKHTGCIGFTFFRLATVSHYI